MTATSRAPLFLTAADVCAALAVSERTLSAMVADSEAAGVEVPRLHIGGIGPGARYRWRAGAIEAWAEDVWRWRASTSESRRPAPGTSSPGEIPALRLCDPLPSTPSTPPSGSSSGVTERVPCDRLGEPATRMAS